MNVEPYAINSEPEIDAYLRSLLATEGNRSEETIRLHCELRLRDPEWKARFMAEGRRMLGEWRARG